MDDGKQKIEDAEELERVRNRARKVRRQSLALAVIGTAIVYAIPV
jgi:hypothetical protein